jgi:hypothetical protein
MMCYICHYRGKMYPYSNQYGDLFILCDECMAVADEIKEYNVNLVKMFEDWAIKQIEAENDNKD